MVESPFCLVPILFSSLRTAGMLRVFVTVVPKEKCIRSESTLPFGLHGLTSTNWLGGRRDYGSVFLPVNSYFRYFRDSLLHDELRANLAVKHEVRKSGLALTATSQWTQDCHCCSEIALTVSSPLMVFRYPSGVWRRSVSSKQMRTGRPSRDQYLRPPCSAPPRVRRRVPRIQKSDRGYAIASSHAACTQPNLRKHELLDRQGPTKNSSTNLPLPVP